MSEFITKNLAEKIIKNYSKNMNLYPLKKQEVDHYLTKIEDEEEKLGMLYTYAYMPVGDIVTYQPEELYPFVKYAFLARRTIAYTKQIPAELFLAYVLFYRMNNENLDGHRESFYGELYPLVSSLDMEQAALQVNYWCYEKATYISTDIRTAAPLTTLKRAEGRCGEESTLSVAALRSVGIPARQCYVPRWAHCDDNHAWVEVWVNGRWYYFGACEPEPVLNKGWFTAAASKSMLAVARTFSDVILEAESKQSSPILEMVNTTATYGECKRIEITVTRKNAPVEGIKVSFELVNAAELYPIYSSFTDGEGIADFFTGLGDIYIHVQDEDRFIYYKMDVRREDRITLKLEDSITTDRFSSVCREAFDLVPPKERVSISLKTEVGEEQIHKEKLTKCETVRENYKKSFFPFSEEKISRQWYLSMARGNKREIEKFQELEQFTQEDKLELLATLSEKDFADITAQILEEYLETSQNYKMKYTEDIYRDYVLAPRVANEMIRKERKWIARFFEGKAVENPLDLWNYMNENIELADEMSCDTILCAASGALLHKVCGKHSYSIVYVSICRALGMAARLNPITHEPEYYDALADGSYGFIPVRADKKPELYPVIIKNASGRQLKYDEQITIARYQDCNYQTLSYPGLQMEDCFHLEAEQGSYRILSCIRQIDGTVSAYAYYFNVPDIGELTVELRDDATESLLKNVELPDTLVENSTHMLLSLRSLTKEKKAVIAFAEPGKEPTEHLLQELLASGQKLNEAGCSVLILLSDWAEADNATLMKVQREADNIGVYVCKDRKYKAQLQEAMQVGDERMPFAMAVTSGFTGQYAFANYNIGTVETLLSILRF